MAKFKLPDEVVFVKENEVFRRVPDINDTRKLINILNSHNLLGNEIVATKIVSENERLVQHEKLSPIIHSGEYTASMLYDILDFSIKLSAMLLKDKIYTFDCHPHNMTYSNGRWILYDFGSFELTPIKVKTQIRNTFKICFASLELLKVIDRKQIKRCFLNRISDSELFRMIPFTSYLRYEILKLLCLTLNVVGLTSLSYKVLYAIYKNYLKKHHFKKYIPQPNNEYDEIDNTIQNFLNSYKINNLFIVGKSGIDWILTKNNGLKTFVYSDDYELTDELYNLIRKNEQYKNISTAVIYPFLDDKKIPENIRYRAIYDNFAQERFKSDCVLFSDFEEILENNKFSVEEICSNLARFFTKLMFIKISKNERLLNNLRETLEDKTEYLEVIPSENSYLLICKGNKISLDNTKPTAESCYKNNNRHVECHIQSEEIINTIRNCKSTNDLPISTLNHKPYQTVYLRP